MSSRDDTTSLLHRMSPTIISKILGNGKVFIVHRAMRWKLSQTTKVYPACERFKLGPGIIFSDDLDVPVTHISQAIYNEYCYQGATPMLNTNPGLAVGQHVKVLPILADSWKDYTRNQRMGDFAYGVVSVVYSLSISAVLTWSLTLFVLTNFTIKPSLLLKVSTSLSSVYLLIVCIKSIISLHKQQLKGYIHGTLLLDHVNGSTYINVIDLIVVILLQINQAQVIMRIFSRQKEKRLTFFVGVTASILSQVIWAVTKFHGGDETSETSDILAAFIYLMRIAMSFCYAALITGFMILKINYLISNKSMWLISLLTLILLYSPIAFFIADISNAWVSELSEIFSVINYVVCVVLPWEWCNKFNVIMKMNEKEGMLGRKFHEDELYELDRYELFVEEDEQENNDQHDNTNESNDNDNTNNDSNNNSNEENDTSTSDNSNGQRENIHQKVEDNSNSSLSITDRQYIRSIDTASSANNINRKVSNIKHVLKDSTFKFLNLTDNFIATVFSIPRPFSSTPPVGFDNRANDAEVDVMGMSSTYIRSSDMTTRNQTGTNLNPTTSGSANMTRSDEGMNRRDVFIYPIRQVTLDVSENED